MKNLFISPSRFIKSCLLAIALACIAITAHARVDMVKVDKSARKMFLMEAGAVIKEYRISLGANPQGHKQQEGDEKTPEGIYTLNYKNEKSSFYRAMHISYPNAADIESANKNGVSPGGFIMVHGQKNGFGGLAYFSRYLDWTDGCIAISNTEMDEFIELVDIGTKIEIEWQTKTPSAE